MLCATPSLPKFLFRNNLSVSTRYIRYIRFSSSTIFKNISAKEQTLLNSVNSPIPAMKLRIATYNIHKGMPMFGRGPCIYPMKHALAALNADMIFLQEVQGRHDRHAVQYGGGKCGTEAHWPDEEQHTFLAGDLPHAVYGMNAVYDHGHHGNALLSAFPIASSRNQDVSDHIYERRGILHCVVQMPTTPVHCFVVHLGLFAGGRERQTNMLIDAVLKHAPPGSPVIIAGDFNDWRNRLSDTLRAKLGVIEVFDQRHASGFGTVLHKLRGHAARYSQPARTFPAALPLLRLDRIYVRGFTVESAQVLHGGLWTKLSDHAPILATLRLQEFTPSQSE